MRTWGARTGLILLLLWHAAALGPRAISADHPLRGCDSPTYAELSEALARGEGYVDPTPGHPPHTKHPPLFSAILALLRLTAGWAAAGSAFVIGCSLAGLLLTWFYLQPVIGGPWALAVTTATALTPAFVDYSGSIMTEVPFLAALMGTLFLLRRAAASQRPVATTWAATAIAATTMLRSVGIAFIPAAAFYLWRASAANPRRGRLVLLLLVLSSIPLAAWVVRNRCSGVAGGTDYMREMVVQDIHGLDDQGRAGLRDYAARVVRNLKHYCEETTRICAFDFPSRLPHPLRSMGYGALPLAVLIGFLVHARAHRDPALPFALVYVGILLVWPWDSLRFLFPLCPLALAWCFLGLRAIAEAGLRRTPQRAPITIVLSVVLLVVWYAPRLSRYAWAVREYLDGSPQARAERESGRRIHDWLETHSNPRDLVLSQDPWLTRLTTGHDGVIFEWSSQPEEALKRIRSRFDVQWILVTPDMMERLVEPQLRRDPRRFPLAHEEGTMRVYAVRSP